MTQDTPNDPLYIASVARAMTVLRAIGSASQPMAVSEVARAAQITQSTTWRICYTLQKLGYLRSDRQGLFGPGLQLLALGHAATAAGGLDQLAAPLLQALVERFNSVAGVGVRDGDDMVYISRLESDRAMLTMNLRAGSRVPILTSCMGWAYLAALAESERASMLSGLRDRHPSVYARVEPVLSKEVLRCAKKGFVVNVGMFHPDVGFVGVPLVHPRTGEIYAFTCGGVSSTVPAARLRGEVGGALCEAVFQLANALGRPV